MWPRGSYILLSTETTLNQVYIQDSSPPSTLVYSIFPTISLAVNISDIGNPGPFAVDEVFSFSPIAVVVVLNLAQIRLKFILSPSLSDSYDGSSGELRSQRYYYYSSLDHLTNIPRLCLQLQIVEYRVQRTENRQQVFRTDRETGRNCLIR